MTIVAGIDFSSSSSAVAVTAAQIAHRRGEELVLAHVADGPMLAKGSDQERMNEKAHQLAAYGCRVRTVLERDGNSGQRLAGLAEREGASLLVIGAQGAALRPVLGTTAISALRHTTLPVLVVRQPQRLWVEKSERRLAALVALAFDTTDEGLLGALDIVASTGPFDADFIHYRALPAVVDKAFAQPLTPLELRDYFSDLPDGVCVRSVMGRDGYGRIDAHLSDLAHELDVDLVVCGSHHRHGIERIWEGSVAEGIVLRCAVSVLVAGAPPRADQLRTMTATSHPDERV